VHKIPFRVLPSDTLLNVPFPAKDQAKTLGAQWHADKKRWVVPAGLDLAPFAAWLD
jgi:hypothetical protein